MFALILLQVAAGPAVPPELSSRFFISRPVDFWGTRAPERARPAPWSEGERPAGPVADLIDDPTPDNARRYLDWQKDRMDRLRKAFAVLEEVQRKAQAIPPPADEILYFTREGCSWCRRQDEVLKELGLKVHRVGPDQPELWKKHGVAATPTLVFPGRKPLKGFQTRDQLKEFIR